MSRFDFVCDELSGDVHVIGFHGSEGLSQLYRYVIHLSVTGEVSLDSLVAARGTLETRPDKTSTEPPHLLHGIIAEAAVLRSHEKSSVLELVLVPALFRLSQSHHSRMFTKTSIPDAVKQVIEDAGLDCELEMRAHGDHPEEEHVCQYHESDLAFITRWLQREGLFYFFDHSGSDSEKIVITDDSQSLASAPESVVRYRPVAGRDVSAGASLRALAFEGRAQPAKVRVADYDYARPALDVGGDTEISSAGVGEIVLHEERTFSPDDAKRLARLRAEAHQARERVARGTGTVFGVHTGLTFEISEHPEDANNIAYVVTELSQRAAQALDDEELLELLGYEIRGYEVDVALLDASLPYRSALPDSWPRIHGYELAVIDGPADSDYAQLDDEGCYLVKMKFDESDLAGDAASTRIRMLQPHAGAPEGWHFPLRKGTEVVIAFVGGDPDRPVIAGALPNATTPSPVTSANNTQNIIRTGGESEIVLEDEQGKQYIFVYTPPEETYMSLGHPFGPPSHNIVLHTKGDNLFDIGTNQDITVGGKLEEKVEKEVDETYEAKQTSKIDGKQDTTVGGDVLELYLAKQTTTVDGGVRDEDFNEGQTTITLGARSETYGGGQNTQTFGGTTEVWLSKMGRTVTGDTFENHNGSLTEVVTGPVTEMYPSSMEEKYGDVLAVWATHLWLSPTITMNAPNWKIITPLKTEFKGLEDEIKLVLGKPEGLNTGSTVFKKETIGSANGATGAKIEATGAKFAVEGPKIEVGILKLAPAAPIDIKIAGLHKK